jgi:cysteine desulfurase / selenocysteine lyase
MWASSFPGLGDRIWLNTAHQGPLPAVAVTAAERALAEKVAPFRIPDDAFAERPAQLRTLLARLIGGHPDDVVLGNSTSHGLHLVANGLTWRDGDEVVVVDGDYPATVLPFLAQPVKVRRVPRDRLLDSFTPRTRVLAVTWVDSFTGAVLDLEALGAACRARDVILVVNASQGVGARPLDVSATPVDVVAACGYKWLCGPYGTGFGWIRPAVRDQLTTRQAYWLAQQAGGSLEHMRDYTIRDLGARSFDVFCPAAFLTNDTFAAAVELFARIGIDAISAYRQSLVRTILAGIDRDRYDVLSPPESNLVVLRPRGEKAGAIVSRLAERGVDAASREGNVRLTPHLFNTTEQIHRACELLMS